MELEIHSSNNEMSNPAFLNTILKITPFDAKTGEMLQEDGLIAKKDTYSIEIQEWEINEEGEKVEIAHYWHYFDKELRNLDYERIMELWDFWMGPKKKSKPIGEKFAKAKDIAAKELRTLRKPKSNLRKLLFTQPESFNLEIVEIKEFVNEPIDPREVSAMTKGERNYIYTTTQGIGTLYLIIFFLNESDEERLWYYTSKEQRDLEFDELQDTYWVKSE